MKAWHGTASPQGRFTDFTRHNGFVSFALDRDHARNYAIGGASALWKPESRLFEVKLEVKNPLDYRLGQHALLVKEYLKRIGFNHFPEKDWDHWIGDRGAYQCLEHPPLLESNSFDAVYTCEFGWRNIHVLDPELVEVIAIHDKDPGSDGLSDLSGNRIESACC